MGRAYAFVMHLCEDVWEYVVHGVIEHWCGAWLYNNVYNITYNYRFVCPPIFCEVMGNYGGDIGEGVWSNDFPKQLLPKIEPSMLLGFKCEQDKRDDGCFDS